ncbi:uncharacterized protein LOC131256610 isoform X2 [Magnolia sinica]|nr:uncharacterized protein LOC131256610 isoform X2 [Magnolia sinica]
MRKKACKIALLIIHRGYTMDPPCPPFECAHMWGPPLVCSLKDSSLHSSLRQPAFDLIHTIIVSDASSLVTLKLKYHVPLSIDTSISADFNDEEDELPLSHDVEEKESSCWNEFSVQSKLTSRECKEWMCIPMLWFDVLIGLDPSTLPISFSKVVFWALSRFSTVEPESSTEMTLSVRDWVSAYAGKISASFGWETPNGSDDGGGGKESRNSVKASTLCIPLIRTFKRCAAHFVVQVEQGDLRKQWTWEPRMAESLILLLVDPNDNVRQVGRVILEHVSKTRGLSSGLQFLCSSASSLSAVYLGLRHAMKLVLLDSVLSNFHNLHHLFFVIRKLLKEVVSSPQKLPNNSINDSNSSKFLSGGGFLHQPSFDSPISTPGSLSNAVDLKSWDKFCCLLSGILWPSILKCLVEGKAFIESKTSQMTCVRVLEMLPVIFERLSSSMFKLFGNSEILACGVYDFKWLRDLMDWGKSSLVVLSRHWKQCVLSLLSLLKDACYDSAFTIGAIERLISCDTVAMDDLKDQVSRLSVSLSIETADFVEKKTLKPKASVFEGLSFERKDAVTAPSSYDNKDVHVQDKVVKSKSRIENKVIVLSDDEAENLVCPDVVILSCSRSTQDTSGVKKSAAIGMLPNADQGKPKPMRVTSSKNLLDAFQFTEVAGHAGLPSRKQDPDAPKNKLPSKLPSFGRTPASLVHSRGIDYKKQENDMSLFQDIADSAHKNTYDRPVHNKSLDQSGSIRTHVTNVDPEEKDIVKKELIHYGEGDPWERALKAAGSSKLLLAKSVVAVPKLQPINDPWERALKASGSSKALLAKSGVTVPKLQTVDEKKQERKACDVSDTFPPRNNTDSVFEDVSNQTVHPKSSGQACTVGSSRTDEDLETRDTVIKELICDTENDPWERALKLAARPQSTKPGVSVAKRQVIQLTMPMGNKSGRFQRMDAAVKRFKPPRLDDWYRPILEIDYFSAVGLSSANEDENATITNFKEVPLCFLSPDHYMEIFRPLILEEFKAQLQNSYVEASSTEMCCGRLCILSVERIDDFHLIRCIPDDGESASSRGCSENDLVLLTKTPPQSSAQNIHVIGKVERREKDNRSRSNILVIRFYLQNSSLRLNKAKRLLVERSKWYVSRIMSLTPQLREFQALSSVKDIPMLPVILNPVDQYVSCSELKTIELGKLSLPMQQVLKSSFNDRQLQAISVAIGTHDSKKAFELSLVQGPPGTGKTKTIVAIVSGLLALGASKKNDSSKTFTSSSRPVSTTGINPRTQISQSVAIARAWQDAAFAKQLAKEGEKSSGSIESSSRGRVLLCAQSNAAVDELVSRISTDGLYGNDGKMYKPYLVRVGNAKTVHPSSLPFFIDTLVEQRLAEEKMNGSDAKNDTDSDSSMALRSKLEKLVDSIRFYESKRANLRDGNVDAKSLSEDGDLKEDAKQEMSDEVIGVKLKVLYAQKKAICVDLAAAQSRERRSSEEVKALKHKLRKAILREAEIVMTTLSGCGGDLYGVCSEPISGYRFGNPSEDSLFDAVVIDEAAQALEPATLIPLQLLKSNGTKCIMVGDPKQLPATVLSNVASKFLYECSMFERLQRAGHPVIMLTEQYRMHPEICQFPSLHFYENKLVNGNQMGSKSAPFHESVYLGPYVFFDVIDGVEQHGKNSGGLSLYNESEANAAVEVLRFFKKRYPSEFFGGRIGIITPYKSQLSLLRSRFNNAFGPGATADMEFNTVDGFQGREVDILILSTVRASDQSVKAPGINSRVIGFVADVRRMNVALTRAKLSLWIVGNSRTLETNINWAALLNNAKERDLVISMERPYESILRKQSSSSMRKLSPTSLDSHSRHLKHAKKVENKGRQSIKETGINAEYAHEGSTKKLDRRGEKRKGRHISDCDSRTVRKHRTSADGDSPSAVFPPQDCGPPKDVKSTTAGRREDKVEKIEEQQGNFASVVCTGKRKDTSEKSSEGIRADVQPEKDASIKTPRWEASKTRLTSSGHGTSGDLSWRNSKLSPPSSEGGHQEKGENIEEQQDNLARVVRRGKEKDTSKKVRSQGVCSDLQSEKDASVRSSKHEGDGKKVGEQQANLAHVVHTGKEKDTSENLSKCLCPDVQLEKEASVRTSRRAASKRKSTSSERGVSGDSSQSNLKLSLPSAESSHQEKEVNGGGKASTQAGSPKDLIALRKKQREAVEALLSSALLTSKKPESLSKPAPAKRPLSPSAASRDVIKPPKPSKAQPSASTNQPQERATGSVRPQNPHSQNMRNHSAHEKDLNEAWESFKDLIRD